MIISFLVLLVVFLGLFVGLLIAYYAYEELLPGKVYFVSLQKVLFALAVFFALYEFDRLVLAIIFLLLFSVLLFWSKRDFHKAMYGVLALFVAFLQSSVVIPALVFFYGFPTAALFCLKHDKKDLLSLSGKLFVENCYFLVVSVLLVLVYDLF